MFAFEPRSNNHHPSGQNRRKRKKCPSARFYRIDQSTSHARGAVRSQKTGRIALESEAADLGHLAGLGRNHHFSRKRSEAGAIRLMSYEISRMARAYGHGGVCVLVGPYACA
ncbi:hypothetical protein Mal15_53510 [Stieleria maiorica]|uniref:Uncharacterized protein n=1 Tax=Stieleria maiorica TaxID=2795974 RepID=A0A5B9MNN3_9BACT|nr:hypothetical protein Mal15_53510 [Stieleria maiorica]